MSDQLLKAVRITDNIKVEVYQQGKKRKYALFYDNQDDHIRSYKIGDNTKSEKYDVAMSDDDVIEMALKAYNFAYGTDEKKYYITQKVYSNPEPIKTYETESQTPVKQYASKIKLTIDGLGSEIIIKAKENLDTFTIWAGAIPKINNIDDYEDVLGEEYIETDSVISDEQQVQSDLKVYQTHGESEGTEDNTTVSRNSINTNIRNAGGYGDRRFQQQLTIRGRVVKNGEIPIDLLAKVDFGGYLLEKNAAVKFSALNRAFKEKFGKNFTISGPYRTFNTSNSIFDWDYFNKTGKSRKIGTNGGIAAAKPGTSKHGWGQAVDIGDFGNGPGNKYFDWMEQNSRKYGWINPTWAKKAGPGYEPWHWEYIGDDLFSI